MDCHECILDPDLYITMYCVSNSICYFLLEAFILSSDLLHAMNIKFADIENQIIDEFCMIKIQLIGFSHVNKLFTGDTSGSCLIPNKLDNQHLVIFIVS